MVYTCRDKVMIEEHRRTFAHLHTPVLVHCQNVSSYGPVTLTQSGMAFIPRS